MKKVFGLFLFRSRSFNKNYPVIRLFHDTCLVTFFHLYHVILKDIGNGIFLPILHIFSELTSNLLLFRHQIFLFPTLIRSLSTSLSTSIFFETLIRSVSSSLVTSLQLSGHYLDFCTLFQRKLYKSISTTLF